MKTRKIVCSLVVCLLMSILTGQSQGQIYQEFRVGGAPPPGMPRRMNPQERLRQKQAEAAKRSRQQEIEREQRMRQLRQQAPMRAKEAAKRRDESIKQALGATDQQWKVIFPRFTKVRTIMREARYGLNVLGYSSGGDSGGGQKFSSSSSATGRSGGSRAGGAGGSSGGSAGAGAYGGGGGVAGGGASGAAVGGRGWKSLGGANNKETGTWSRSGWKWSKPSENKKHSELTRAERAAEELLNGLENKQISRGKIQEKLAAFRKVRDEALKQLPKAQQELREVLTFDQEAKLVLMGYLE